MSGSLPAFQASGRPRPPEIEEKCGDVRRVYGLGLTKRMGFHAGPEREAWDGTEHPAISKGCREVSGGSMSGGSKGLIMRLLGNPMRVRGGEIAA